MFFIFCATCVHFHELGLGWEYIGLGWEYLDLGWEYLGLGWEYLATSCFCCVANFIRFFWDVPLGEGMEVNSILGTYVV